MPQLALTDLGLKALKAERTTTFWDTGLANFGVRVGKRRKTFVVLVGATERRRCNLGTYPSTSLSEARKLAREKLAEKVLKIERPEPIKVDEALTLFLSTHSKNKHAPRTAHECRRLLSRYVEARFTGRELSTIKPAELAR